VFLTGTAAEVTPIREVDGRQIGAGRRGPLTTKLQKAFFDLVNGKNKRYAQWLAPVYDAKAKPARKKAK
jgi:branched-chain amino acid aminotransferase